MTFHIVWTNGNVIPIDHSGCDERNETPEQQVQRLAENFPYFIYFTTDAQEAPMTETPARPMIDFSDAERDRSQARQYAADLDSRVLKPENRAVLQAASRGEKVDAYDLNRAVTEGLSSCATRLGQSMARRELTRKGRHLGYIAQAVLENHADGLPGMEPGARSRKIETLEGQIAALEAAGRDALAQVEPLTARLDEERQARESLIAIHNGRLKTLANERDEARDRAVKAEYAAELLDERVTEVVAEKTYAEAKLSDAEAEIAWLRATLEYAQTFADSETVARVLGFQDALTRKA